MPPTQPPYKLQLWPTHLMVLVACGVTLLTLIHPSATRQHTWPWAPLMFLGWLAPLIAVAGRMVFRTSWRWPNPLLRSSFSLLTGITLLSAALSPFAQHSLLRIWPTLGGVLFYFWLHDWLAESAAEHRHRIRILTQGFATFGALLTAISLLGWIWTNQGVVWTVRNDFPFGHSIYTAGALVMVIPWLVFACVKTQGGRRAAWAMAALLAFLALLTTSSRGGVLALGAVSIGFAGISVRRARWSPTIKTVLVILSVAALAIAVWSNPRLRELTQGQGWSAASRESNTQRSAMIEAGIKLGKARPYLGWGPGTVPLTYPQIRHQLSGGVDTVLQLHNSPAQIWASLGTGGLLALILFLAAVARRGWQVARQASPSSFTLASTASLFGYGLFSLTDHQLDVPAMNAMLVLTLALFFAEEPPATSLPLTRATKRYFLLATAFVLAIPALLTGRDLLARYAYAQSLILFDHHQSDLGLQYLETAAQRAPYDPYYRHQLAGRYLEQRDKSSDPATRALLSAEATSQLEQSLATDCLQEFAHFNLGWLALETDEPARAIPHFLATLQEAPHRGGAYFGLGLAFRAAGNQPAAVRAFALEWVNDPLAFTAPLWEWPDFSPLRPLIAREADALLAELGPTRPTARYIRIFWQWWENGAPLPDRGFNGESDLFALTLAQLARGKPAPAGSEQFLWGSLYQNWSQSPNAPTMKTLAGKDEMFAAALVRRAARHPPPQWREFFTAGLENEAALLTSTKFSRPGYGVVALHPDGPVLSNLYVMQQNRFATLFASGLLPPKGWLTAQELLARLPAPPPVQP